MVAMPSNCCDVLIVGAGPAGLATAIALCQRGADVLLADSQKPPIDKACGEGIMPDSRRDLAGIGVDLPDFCGAPFKGIRFCDEHASVAADFPFGEGRGVRRTVLHRLLTDRATAAGVRLAWQTGVAIKPGHPFAIGGSPVKYKYLIGADGQSSRIRTWAGLDRGAVLTSRFGYRIHYRIPPWSSHVEVYWSSKGQAYVTPISDNEVCCSVMTRFAGRTRSYEIVAGIPELTQRLKGAEIITRERGAITTTRRLKCVTRGNIALVGDASGSVDAVTGEGLALGFRQALKLADAISRDDLTLYENLHPTMMRLPQMMSRIMLLMGRWPVLRRRALRTMADDPAIFQTLLGVHLGEKPLRQFLLQQGPGFGLRLLLPSLA